LFSCPAAFLFFGIAVVVVVDGTAGLTAFPCTMKSAFESVYVALNMVVVSACDPVWAAGWWRWSEALLVMDTAFLLAMAFAFFDLLVFVAEPLDGFFFLGFATEHESLFAADGSLVTEVCFPVWNLIMPRSSVAFTVDMLGVRTTMMLALWVGHRSLKHAWTLSCVAHSCYAMPFLRIWLPTVPPGSSEIL
jgi:hypothetical protein